MWFRFSRRSAEETAWCLCCMESRRSQVPALDPSSHDGLVGLKGPLIDPDLGPKMEL